MKIQITDDEFYEIKMPEQIGIQEFRGIVMKFNFLLKNFSKFDIGNENSDGDIVLSEKQTRNGSKHNKDRWNLLKDNRELFIEFLKVYYSKDFGKLEELFEKHNVYFKRSKFSSVNMIRLREYHKLNPQELGLSQFPTKYKQVEEVKLENSDSEEKIENE